MRTSADILRLLAGSEDRFLMLEQNIISLCDGDWAAVLQNDEVVYVSTDIFDDLMRWDYIAEDRTEVRIGRSVFRLTALGAEQAEK